MRDAFGGTFTMNFLLVFIFIYIAFTAVSLNYAKAFKVKNAVIDFVEQNEIIDLDDYFSAGYWDGPLYHVSAATKNPSKLDEVLKKLSYHQTCDLLGYEEGKRQDTKYGEGYCYKGVLITEKKEQPIDGTNSKIVYYQIVTYADWELGALNKLLALAGRNEKSESPLSGTWEVKGEAKVVVKE